MSWYFAYGSNMSAVRLFDERLVPAGVAAGERIAGRLDGWRLAFNKSAREPAGSGAGNIVAAEGASVFGTLNRLPAAGFTVLDRYEGVATGHYQRRTVAVMRLDTGGVLEAITYVALLTRPGPEADPSLSRPSAGRQRPAAGRLCPAAGRDPDSRLISRLSFLPALEVDRLTLLRLGRTRHREEGERG